MVSHSIQSNVYTWMLWAVVAVSSTSIFVDNLVAIYSGRGLRMSRYLVGDSAVQRGSHPLHLHGLVADVSSPAEAQHCLHARVSISTLRAGFH